MANGSRSKILLAALAAALLTGTSFCAAAARRGRERGVAAFVLSGSRRRLADRWKGRAPEISEAILAESRRNGMDPVFLMAVIANESSFNPGALGSHGEIGLMQLKPDTARWIAQVKHVPYRGRRTLFDPAQNIRLGAAYLGYLKERYGRDSRLYLAAYNMGCGSVSRALAARRRVDAYPLRVLKHYEGLYAELRTGLRRPRA